MASSVLSIDELTFRYSARHEPIFDGMSFRIHSGQKVSIFGANGVGKSTLVNLCLGMLQPNKGTIKLFGSQVRSTSQLSQLGVMGSLGHRESSTALPNDVRVVDLLRVYHTAIKENLSAISHELFGCLGLSKLSRPTIYVGNLSKGERQRLIAYLALAKRPRLVLADEPFEGLDTCSTEVIHNALQACLAHGDTALLLISHRVCESLEFANTHYRLVEGKLQLIDRTTFQIQLTLNSLPVANSQEYPELVFERLAKLASVGSLESATIALERVYA